MASKNSSGDQLLQNLSINDDTEAAVQHLSENYILIDICANLVNKKYTRDLDAVVQRAKEAGVKKMIVVGTSVHTTKEALRLTRMFPGTLYCAAGIHPHDAKSWEDDTIDTLRETAANPECVAIGECGLDFNKDFSPRDTQLEVLEAQVNLACELKKPLILHEREAFNDMVAILEKFRERLPPTVIHCFTGSPEQAKKYVSLGLCLGITGYIWKDKGGLREALEKGLVPLDRILLETDCPFMCPNPRGAKLTPEVRGAVSATSLRLLERYCSFQRNEPCSLPATLELTAAFLGVPPQDLALKCTYTALKIFGLD
ncbi:3'-5' ssDNA/RNA exonuclease TatD-like [Ornithodoros turicata]